ncbi:MAG: DUF1648 domain-containing protein [Candidatus Staskawiczbacteria bacterium]|jgi:uncharacterized membrane protein
MNKSTIISILVLITTFAISFYFYPQLPERLASHWNARGEVDGYSSKAFGLFLIPVMSLALFSLLSLVPKIDPLKKNIESFRKYYDLFILLFLLFFLYIHLIIILWGLDIRVDMNMALLPAFVILFYFVGVLIEHSKRNWFIGIRTPWTLSSDIVWDKTHKLGGILFKAGAIVSAFGLFFPDYVILFILFPAVVSAIYPVIYSYFVFRKQ